MIMGIGIPTSQSKTPRIKPSYCCEHKLLTRNKVPPDLIFFPLLEHILTERVESGSESPVEWIGIERGDGNELCDLPSGLSGRGLVCLVLFRTALTAFRTINPSFNWSNSNG